MSSVLTHCSFCVGTVCGCFVWQVSQWLSSIGLPQYKTLFRQNEIDGKTLVDMGTSDLDYLGIKALGEWQRRT